MDECMVYTNIIIWLKCKYFMSTLVKKSITVVTLILSKLSLELHYSVGFFIEKNIMDSTKATVQRIIIHFRFNNANIINIINMYLLLTYLCVGESLIFGNFFHSLSSVLLRGEKNLWKILETCWDFLETL